MAGRDIDTKSNPTKDTIFNGVTKKSVLEEGVRSGILSLNLNHVVIDVLGDSNGAGVVGEGSLDLGDQVLVEEELADVGDVAASKGVVGQNMGVGMSNDVNVSGTARVVTGENGLELGNTIGVGLLDSTKEGLVQVGGIVAVAVHRALDTGVDTGGIAVPDIPVQVLDRLTGVDVNELTIHDEGNTSLTIGHILTDELTLDPEGAYLPLGGENADRAIREQLRLISVGSHLGGGVVVLGDSLVGIASFEDVALVCLENGGTTGTSALIDTTLLKVVGTEIEGAASIVKEVTLGHARV